jgi:epoxyqueuosine reductase
VRRFTEQTREDDFRPFDIDRAAPPRRDMLKLSAAGFEQLFGGSPIKRIGYDRFMRNVCIAAGNSGEKSMRPLLESIATRSEEIPLASEHAGWALDVVS